MYFAHSLLDINDKSNWHTLQDHLLSTGRDAGIFAREFGAENAAKIAGLLHDLGKYSSKFQARLNGSQESVDHATAGAKEIIGIAKTPGDKITAELISYAIAGHHAGLADYAQLQDTFNKPIEPVDEIWRKEIDIDFEQVR